MNYTINFGELEPCDFSAPVRWSHLAPGEFVFLEVNKKEKSSEKLNNCDKTVHRDAVILGSLVIPRAKIGEFHWFMACRLAAIS